MKIISPVSGQSFDFYPGNYSAEENTCCMFLGSHNGADLYYCWVHDTPIARLASEPSEYVSGKAAALQAPLMHADLAEAMRRYKIVIELASSRQI